MYIKNQFTKNRCQETPKDVKHPLTRATFTIQQCNDYSKPVSNKNDNAKQYILKNMNKNKEFFLQEKQNRKKTINTIVKQDIY